VDEIQFGPTTLENQYGGVSYALKLTKSLQAHGISGSTSRRIVSTMEKKEFWEEKYKSNTIVLSPPSISVSNQPLGRENKFVAWHKKKTGIQMEMDEYTRYLQAPLLTKIKDSRSWWLEPTQRHIYPNLSLMAINILSIPAMSVEPERLFSGSKLTVTDIISWELNLSRLQSA
jgi:hypothetical protein